MVWILALSLGCVLRAENVSITPEASERIKICLVKFRNLVEVSARNNFTQSHASTPIKVTTLNQLKAALRQLSDQARAKAAIDLLDKTLAGNLEGTNPLMNRTLHALERDMSDTSQSDFLSCLIGGVCRTSTAGVASVNWKNVREGKQGVPVTRESLRGKLIKAEPGTEFVTLRALNPNNAASDAEWVATLLHEYTHHLDYSLVAKWLNANQKLILDGKTPDEKFSKYVRVENGELIVDPDFLNVFLESRAHAVSENLFHVHRENHLQIREVISAIRAIGAETPPETFDALVPQAGDWQQTAQQLGDEMEATIRIAGMRP